MKPILALWTLTVVCVMTWVGTYNEWRGKGKKRYQNFMTSLSISLGLSVLCVLSWVL